MVLYFFLIFFSHSISFFIIMTFVVSAANTKGKSSGSGGSTETGTGTGSSKVDSTKIPDSARVRSDSTVMLGSMESSTNVLSSTPKDLPK